MIRRLARVGAPLLGALALLVLSRADAAVAALPALGLLRGPLGAALAGLGVLAACLPAAGARLDARLARAHPLALPAAAGVAFAAAGLYYAERLHPSGDEPHYLLMAQSLWREGDLDLRDNFARGDHLEYVPGLAGPHYGAPRADGRPFPAHSPGLPALLAPAYALGGRRACVLLMALLVAACVAQVRALATQLGATPPAAAFAGLAAAGPPLGVYAFHLYTEIPAALAVAAALRLLLRPAGANGRRDPAAAATAALLAGCLPWLHVKMVPAAAALGVIALAGLRGRARAVFVLTAGALALANGFYYHSIFGVPTPLGLFGGGMPRGVQPAPLRAAAGLLLDRSFGLLPHAPVFLLALAAAPALRYAWKAGGEGTAHGRRAALAAHLAVATSILAPVLAWRMWWGGMCPPARFLVPLVPSLAALLALRLGPTAAEAGRGLARWRWPLLAAGLALTAFTVARPADLLLLDRRDRPTRVWEALAGAGPEGSVTLGRYLPSLVLPSAAEARTGGAWLLGLAGLLLLDARARRRGLDGPAPPAQVS